MKKSRLTEDQMMGIFKQHEAGIKTADLCRVSRAEQNQASVAE